MLFQRILDRLANGFKIRGMRCGKRSMYLIGRWNHNASLAVDRGGNERPRAGEDANARLPERGRDMQQTGIVADEYVCRRNAVR